MSDTTRCTVVSDEAVQKALLDDVRPSVDKIPTRGGHDTTENMLSTYNPVFHECQYNYVVTFDAVTNPNSTTVFTGSDEQYLVYKNGRGVVGPLDDR